jgi:hypothetical protein
MKVVCYINVHGMEVYSLHVSAPAGILLSLTLNIFHIVVHHDMPCSLLWREEAYKHAFIHNLAVREEEEKSFSLHIQPMISARLQVGLWYCTPSHSVDTGLATYGLNHGRKHLPRLEVMSKN